MHRFRTPEIIIGLGLGIILSLFVAGIGSYQASHCEQGNQTHAAAPNANDPHTTGQQSGGGDHKKPEHAKHPPFFACGASGLLKSTVGFMDSHEGFFVGGFTLSLFFATILLWRSTEKLWAEAKDSSERQATDTRTLQRAYISVEPGGVVSSSDPTKCHFNFIISNAGNLPARNIRWTTDWLMSQNDRLQVLPLDTSDLKGDITLTPKGIMIQGGTRIVYVGSEEGELSEKIGWYLYVWGAVFYDNGFGEERVTRFCHRYNTVNLEWADVQKGVAVGTPRGRKIEAEHARFNRYGNDAT